MMRLIGYNIFLCMSGLGLFVLHRDDGHLVSYGAMSKLPLSLPTSLFIFKNLTAHGFMLASWIRRHPIEERRNVMKEIIGMLERGQVNFIFNYCCALTNFMPLQIREPVHEILPLHGSDDEITQTLRNALSKLEGGSYGKKFILQFVE